MADTTFTTITNPPMDRIRELEAGGFDTGCGSAAIQAREMAAQRFASLASRGVIHGDMHLRNMLVADDGRIHFIDFGCAGPGHPALDLVRLEMALYAGPVRQFESDDRCAELQEAISVNFASIEVLQERFTRFFQCHINRVCANGIVAARDAACEAVMAHGGGVRDYQAAKYLVAWQYLGVIGVQTGMVRGAIAALSREIADW